MLSSLHFIEEVSVLLISKREAQNYDKEKFRLEKPSDVEVKGEYRCEIATRFAALENWIDKVDINRACESMGENV
jgi:hypothetical protein